MRSNCVRARTIPKGLWPSAQGCEERATLGSRWEVETTPKALWPRPGARAGAHGSQSRCGWGGFSADDPGERRTTGTMFRFAKGSCLATLGFGTESRWDSQRGAPPANRQVNPAILSPATVKQSPHANKSSIFTGSSRTRAPVAWWIAAVMAAAMPAKPISPIPRAPSSLISLSG